MLRCYAGTDLAWDTEKEKWVKPVSESEANEVLENPENLLEYKGEDRVVHITEFPIQNDGDQKTFFSSYSVFDEKLGGIQAGEVVVITGHTKNGKTLFAESWMKNLMQQDPTAKCVFFSFEVQTGKLIQKYLSDPTIKLYVPLQLKTMDFQWLKQRCLEGRDKFGCRLVLVDHLHFLVDMNTKQNMSLNIGAFMRRLKQEIAIGLGMAVVLIAHQGQAREGQAASLHTIRDSSFVAQEADSIITVSRCKNYNAVELIDFEKTHGEEKRFMLESLINPLNAEDNYSMRLAIVSIERTRRTGVFEFKKLFIKKDQFLEEV